MCRNIRQLRQPGSEPSTEEIRLAALQYVRKVSGYRTPSRQNQLAFERAVTEIAASTEKLLLGLQPRRASEHRERRPDAEG
jgi:hypothetical protein